MATVCMYLLPTYQCHCSKEFFLYRIEILTINQFITSSPPIATLYQVLCSQEGDGKSCSVHPRSGYLSFMIGLPFNFAVFVALCNYQTEYKFQHRRRYYRSILLILARGPTSNSRSSSRADIFGIGGIKETAFHKLPLHLVPFL
jgi:hypothetical protein